MDKTLIRRRFAKAVGSYSIRADVQRQIAYHMADAIGKYIPSGGRRNVLEIGCGTGMFTRAFLHRATPERLLLNDLCPEVEPYLTDLLANKRIHFAASDAEALNFPSGQNLIVSWSGTRSQLYIIRCRTVQQPLTFLFADRKYMNTISTQIIGKQQTTIRCKKHTMQMRLALPFLIRSASRKGERITFQQFPATS